MKRVSAAESMTTGKWYTLGAEQLWEDGQLLRARYSAPRLEYHYSDVEAMSSMIDYYSKFKTSIW